MIKAQDLRIGNLIWNPIQQCYVRVDLQVLSSIISDDYNKTKEEHRFQPIKLTEEILLKCGFTKYEWCTDCAFISYQGSHLMIRYYNESWHVTKTKVSTDSRGQKMSHGWNIVKKDSIKYIHELQNFYYWTNGKKELEIKL